jgi:hypothetical protein
MIVHINQPRFLPALNYFARMLLADVFVYLDNVQFSKQDWENRNKIKMPGGSHWLTVPVKKAPETTPLRDIRIDNSQNWRHKMLATMRTAYGRAPYFEEWFPRFSAELNREWDSLFYLNLCMIDVFRAAWCITGRAEFASCLPVSSTGDRRNLEICQHFGAVKYLAGAEGRNYCDIEMWAAAGIGIEFHKYAYPAYPQQHGEFIPWMSAIDLLMNCGSAGRNYLLHGPECRKPRPVPAASH